MADLASVADELYALGLDDFTAARNERAKQLASTGGSPELVRAVRSLPKPSAAASATNALVRANPAAIDELLELGERLREAQRTTDAAALRSLGVTRRALVAALSAEARAVVAERGERFGPAAVIELNQTLQAALADAWAGAAVRSGRLVASLNSVGFEPVALEGAVAAPAGSLAEASGVTKGDEGSDARATARSEAEAERELAHSLAEEAAAELEEAERRETEATQRSDSLDAEVRAARERLAALERELTAAEKHAREAARARTRAARAADAARVDAERAAAAVEELDA